MADFERQLRRAAEQFEAARERRDAVIVKASEAGMPRRRVAELVGLSASRVQQVVVERSRTR
jgi:transposase